MTTNTINVYFSGDESQDLGSVENLTAEEIKRLNALNNDDLMYCRENPIIVIDFVNDDGDMESTVYLSTNNAIQFFDEIKINEISDKIKKLMETNDDN